MKNAVYDQRFYTFLNFRWMQECAAGSRCCPSCKTRAYNRDIRPIYAKKLCAVDKSEEYRLQVLVDSERLKVGKLSQDVAILKVELELQRKVTFRLEEQLEKLRNTNVLDLAADSESSSQARPKMFKLFMEKNIIICKEPGCRVLIYGNQSKNLIVSQKSTQALFPGYGVRFLDIPTFRPSQFMHMSSKQVRDLSFDMDEENLAAASMDRSLKVYNIHNKCVVNTFTPCDKPIWAVAFDRNRTKLAYFGSQHGTTFAYDVRNPNVFLNEYKTDGDLSPVINICSIPFTEEFPFGGFLVCKLQSVWFNEYCANEEIISTKLNIIGPFVSMNYDDATNHVLISTRPSSTSPSSRYIIGTLYKVGEAVLLKNTVTMHGSKVQSVMTRSAQINIDNNILVAAYLQDTKLLTTWNVQNSERMQSLSINETVLDTCPIYINDEVYLSALTDCRCRIFKVRSNNKSIS